MSTVVDNRIVSMEFDNYDFEKNVKVSMNSIDKLKRKLNFSDTADSFNDIEKSAKKVKLAGLTDAVDKVQLKFNALQVAATTAIATMTNKAINAGGQMLKSLTVDNIASGWDKYAEKTTAVATMMANIDFKGTETEKMDYINQALEKMSWFTDETSYNFTQMVANASKFVANGVKLEEAANAMQGVATWAALSGQNSSVATHVMEQLSQAIGSGTVKLQDWQSVEQATMDNLEFKTRLLQNAVSNELLTLDEATGKYYLNTQKAGKAAEGSLDAATRGMQAYGVAAEQANVATKGIEVTAENLRSTLSEGWLTSKVLVDTLNEYGGFATRLYEVMTETGSDATTSSWMDAIDDYLSGAKSIDQLYDELEVDRSVNLEKYFKELSDQTYEFGRKALRAAQEAKTFQEAVDSVRVAAASKWSNAFEAIFGDYEEQRKNWTALANDLYDAFIPTIEYFSDALKIWRRDGGAEILFGEEGVYEHFKAIITSIFGEDGVIQTSFRQIFGLSDDYDERVESLGQRLLSISGKVRDRLADIARRLAPEIINENGEVEQEAGDLYVKFQKLAKGVMSFFSILKQMHEGVKTAFRPLKELLFAVIDKLFGFTADGAGLITLVDEAAKESKIFVTIGEKVASVLEWLTKPLRKLLGIGEDLSENKAAKNLSEWFENLSSGIKKSKLGSLLSDAFFSIKTFFKDIFGKVYEKFEPAMDKVASIGPFFKSIFTFLFDTIKLFASHIQKSLPALKVIFTIVGDIVTKLIDKLAELLQKVKNYDWKGSVFGQLWELLKAVGQLIGRIIKNSFAPRLRDKIKEWTDAINSNDGKIIYENVQAFFSYLWKVAKIVLGFVIIYKVLHLMLNLIWEFAAWFNPVEYVLGNIGDMFYELQEYIADLRMSRWFSAIGNLFIKVAASLWIASKAFERFKNIDMYSIVKAVIALGSFVTAVGGILLMIELMKVRAYDINVLKQFFNIVSKLSLVMLIIGVALRIFNGVNLHNALIGIGSLAAITLGVGEVLNLLRKAKVTFADISMLSAFMALVSAMALVVGALAGAFWMFKFLNIGLDEMLTGFAALAGMILAVGIVLVAIKRQSIDASNVPMFAVFFAMVTAMTVLLGGLAYALVWFKLIKWPEIIRGIGSLALLIGVLGAVLYGMKRFHLGDKSMIPMFATMMAMVTAMAGVMALLPLIFKGFVDTQLPEIGKAILSLIFIVSAVGLLLLALRRSELTVQDIGMFATTIGAVATLAGVMAILAKTTKMFEDVKWVEGMVKGFTALIAVVGLVVGMTAAVKKFMSKSAGVVAQLMAFTAAVTVLSGTIGILALVTKMFEDVDWKEGLLKGLVALLSITVVLGGIAVALHYFPVGAPMLLAFAGAILIVAGAAWVLADALQKMAEAFVTLQEINGDAIKNLLKAIGEGISAMNLGIKNTAAVTLAGVGFLALSSGLKALAEIKDSLPDIADGLAKFFKVMENPVGLRKFVLWFGVLSGIILLTAPALALIIVSISALVLSVSVGAAAILASITGLVAIFKTFGSQEELAEFVEGVSKAIVRIVRAIGEGIVEIIKILNENIEPIKTFINNVMDIAWTAFLNLLYKFRLNASWIAAQIVEIIIAFLKEIDKRIDEINELLTSMLLKSIDGILTGIDKNIGTIIGRLVDILVSIITGIANAVSSKASKIRAALEDLRNAIYKAILVILFGLEDTVADNLVRLADKAGDGITNAITAALSKIIGVDLTKDYSSVAPVTTDEYARTLTSTHGRVVQAADEEVAWATEYQRYGGSGPYSANTNTYNDTITNNYYITNPDPNAVMAEIERYNLQQKRSLVKNSAFSGAGKHF